MFLSWGSIFGGPSVVHVSCGSCKLTSAFKTNSACKQERIAESSRKILRLRVSFFLALETNGNFLLSDHPPPFPLCTPPTSRQYYCSKISFHLGCCHPSLVPWRSFWVSVFFFLNRIHCPTCSRKVYGRMRSLRTLCRQLHDPAVRCHANATTKLFVALRDHKTS